MKEKQNEAIRELLYKMADDLLIIGHRNSEWTGLGPILEEDIAFSSMAQDKLGHAQALYAILHEMGEEAPDANAFMRNAGEFHNSQFTELPNGDYAFSLIRHFLYDHADQLRFDMLAASTCEPLAKVSRKIKGELKYHVFHGNTWISKLGPSTEEGHARMQTALNDAWNFALGLFEQGPNEQVLISAGVFTGEEALKEKWLSVIIPLLEKATLTVPHSSDWKPVVGGRTGIHTEYLQPLVEEMGEVFRIDPKAEW